MECHIARDQIGPYVDGELSRGDVSALEDHLGGCPECAAELARTRELVARFSVEPALASSPPSNLWSRIEERLEVRPRRGPVILRIFRKPLAMAASLAIILGAGVFVAVWLAPPAASVAQADTVDYRLLLDGLTKDADAAVDKFLNHYKATPMEPAEIASQSAPMHFSIPQTLPGGYRLEQSYRLQFGSNAGFAARYRRGTEPVFVCFHKPVSKTEMGVHRESHCMLAEGSHCVEVGPWQLIHFTDPNTCHCLLSRSTDENELKAMLAAIAPGLVTSSQPSN